MCTEIHNRETNAEFGSIPELEAMIAPHPLITWDESPEIDRECCLCQIDVKATLERAGFAYHEVQHDPMAVATWPLNSPNADRHLSDHRKWEAEYEGEMRKLFARADRH